MTYSRFIAGAICLTLLALASIGRAQSPVLQPRSDARLVYVSPERGNDANHGTHDAPVRTADRGLALLRNGYGDWLLLERGHEYRLEHAVMMPRGAAPDVPIVIAAFGSGETPELHVGPNRQAFSYQELLADYITVAPTVQLTGLADPFPILQPGNGWTGPTPQPEPVGKPGMAGYDAKAIARWDVVPYQTFEGDFHIGVVAFHMNGIDRVEFSVEGGPWTPVHQMQLNPRTNVWEYTATLRASDFESTKPIEVRAIIYPKKGISRVLQGAIEGNAVHRGTHSMFLWANPHKTSHVYVYVDPNSGSDTQGDGSKDNPYQSLAKAARDGLARTAVGQELTIRCAAGQYVLDKKLATLRHPDRWVTIEPMSGHSSSDVRLIKSEVGALGVERLCLRNIGITGVVRVAIGALWLDNIDFDGQDLTKDGKVISPAWSPNGIWVTGGTAQGSRNVLRDATFYRNHRVINTSGSPFGGSGCTINSHCDEYVLTNFHGDVWHWLVGTIDESSDAADVNVIAYNVTVGRFPTQGIFAEVFPNDRIGTPVHFNNVAFVNVSFADMPDLDQSSNMKYRGGWWEAQTNHLIMREVHTPRHLMRWNPSQYNTTVRNVSITDSTFYAFANTRLPEGTIIRNVRFTNPGLYGAWVPAEYDPSQ